MVYIESPGCDSTENVLNKHCTLHYVGEGKRGCRWLINEANARIRKNSRSRFRQTGRRALVVSCTGGTRSHTYIYI